MVSSPHLDASPRPYDDPLAGHAEALARAEEGVRRAQTFEAGLAGIRGHGRHGGVHVEVDARGRLVALSFAPGSLAAGERAVQDAILRALAAAHAEASSQVTQHASAVWGSESVTARQVAVDAAALHGSADGAVRHG